MCQYVNAITRFAGVTFFDFIQTIKQPENTFLIVLLNWPWHNDNSHHKDLRRLYRAFNLFSANPIKWSNTLKQFVGKLPMNSLSVWPFYGVGAQRINMPLETILKYIFWLSTKACFPLTSLLFVVLHEIYWLLLKSISLKLHQTFKLICDWVWAASLNSIKKWNLPKTFR